MSAGLDKLVQRIRKRQQVPPEERKRIRMEAGVSLRELADALGVSHTSVANWERGRYSALHSEHLDDYFRALERIRRAMGNGS